VILKQLKTNGAGVLKRSSIPVAVNKGVCQMQPRHLVWNKNRDLWEKVYIGLTHGYNLGKQNHVLTLMQHWNIFVIPVQFILLADAAVT